MEWSEETKTKREEISGEASAHAARNRVHGNRRWRAPQAPSPPRTAHVYPRKNIRHVDGPRSPTTLTNHHSTVEVS